MFVLGSGLIVASAVGGSYGALPGEIVIVIAATVLFAVLSRRSRSDIGAIMGLASDERQASIDLRAAASAGGTLAVILIIGAMIGLGMGHSGQPWVALGAAFGVLYVGFLFVFRRLG
jgi:hypothetical protein